MRLSFRGILGWVLQVTPMRIAVLTALLFAGIHFTIEYEFFEYGPLSKNGFIHLMDLKSLDLKFQSRHQGNLPTPQVVIAAIDEKSVERYGLWPWNRTVIADFIRKTSDAGAKVIGFDAVFSDEDKNSSYVTMKRFVDEIASLGPDSTQAQKLATGVQDADLQLYESQKTFAELERKVHEGRVDPAVNKAMAAMKRSVAHSERNLQASRENLQAWQKLAGGVYKHIQHETMARSPDDALAEAIASSPQTILGYFNFYSHDEILGINPKDLVNEAARIDRVAIKELFERTTQEIGNQEITIVQPSKAKISKLQVTDAVAIRAPLTKLALGAKGFGYFNVRPDEDGPMRRVRTLNRYNKDELFPALSIISAGRALGADPKPLMVEGDESNLAGIYLTPELTIPTDWHGRLMVNFYTNPEHYFPKFSVADFIEGKVPQEQIKDRVVLFGMTAQGLYDLRATPFSASTPGVYIHAATIQSILDNRFLERWDGLVLVEMLLFLALGAIMGLVLPRLSAVWGLLGTIGFAVGLYFIDVLWIFPRGTWLLNVLPTLQAAVTYTGISLYGYLTEGREKQKIRSAFQFYLTKSVVEEMLKDPSKLRLGGERRVCTVLFSDVRGFTTISEKLSPEELVQLLNSYLTPMTNLVFKYDGTLDKYMGDAIMAIFGAPVDYENHASRACYAALEMLADLHRLQEGWRAQNLPELDIGIGLNTGAMSVGNMGSESRFDYTVMGDNVNLGSRLEGINKQYGTHIIVSEFTYEAAKNDVYVRELDSVRVKGKHEPVRIYELMGRGKPSAQDADVIATFQQGIGEYKAQRWNSAVTLFNRVRGELKPEDYASEMYVERCESMRAAPPGADWDGVYTMTSK